MKTRATAAATALLLSSFTVTTAPLGHAALPTETTESILAEANSFVGNHNRRAVETHDGYVAEAEGVTIEIPDNPQAPIDITSEGSGPTQSLSISLLDTQENLPAAPSELGGVHYDSTDPHSTTVLPKVDGSLQILTVIENADAPRAYSYKISGSEGSTMTLEEDGSVAIFSADGEWEAGVAAPWAKDANGKDLPSWYSVDGKTLTQHIEFDENSAFPVVADPWLGKDLIKKTVWAKNLWKWSPTLKVYPTLWGRTTGVAARHAGWKETLAKTKRKGWPNPNTASMKNQFYCHFDLVRIRSPRKESWNLDTKIPNRGYAGFVKNGCN